MKNPSCTLNARLSFLNPLTPLVIFYLLGLFIFFAFRAVLCLKYFSRMQEVQSYFLLFPIGFRIDTMLLCYLLIPPFLVQLFLPVKKITSRIRRLMALYFTVCASLFVFLEVATFPFMAEFDTRLDRLFLEHMV
ncbi:MAG: hypothetical protein WCQ99_04830, partial [Pseudomonadota bacterium]